mmetsp:Transcript_96190/g.299652  ORF Transcript_96190/g.299652 Transcript_96190/m.299652 type:complete len:89 (+) Transcript_96190:1616-1882(+)
MPRGTLMRIKQLSVKEALHVCRRRSSVRASAKAVANSSSDGRRERHTAEQASPFGDTVGDEELKKWGASPEEMPLLRSGRPVSAAPQS